MDHDKGKEQKLYLKILFIFRESGRKGEREGEKHQCVVASHTSPPGDPACNPGMCPDRESNPRPFGSQASTQSTQSRQPGQRSEIALKYGNTLIYNLNDKIFQGTKLVHRIFKFPFYNIVKHRIDP